MYTYFSTAGMYCGHGIMYCKLGQLGLFFGSFFWFVYHSSPHFLDGYRMVLLLICQVSSILFLSLESRPVFCFLFILIHLTFLYRTQFYTECKGPISIGNHL